MATTKRVAIRYLQHHDQGMVGRTVTTIRTVRTTNKDAEQIKTDLNIFFAAEGLPYYAAITEEGEIGAVRAL